MIKVENKILIEVGNQKLALTNEEARELYEQLAKIYSKPPSLTRESLEEMRRRWADDNYKPPKPIIYGPIRPSMPYEVGDVCPNPFEVTCKQ